MVIALAEIKLDVIWPTAILSPVIVADANRLPVNVVGAILSPVIALV